MTKNLRDIDQSLNSCSYKLKMYYSNTNLTNITGISCFLQSPKTCFRGFTLNEMK
jgi:hypothetical protein